MNEVQVDSMASSEPGEHPTELSLYDQRAFLPLRRLISESDLFKEGADSKFADKLLGHFLTGGNYAGDSDLWRSLKSDKRSTLPLVQSKLYTLIEEQADELRWIPEYVRSLTGTREYKLDGTLGIEITRRKEKPKAVMSYRQFFEAQKRLEKGARDAVLIGIDEELIIKSDLPPFNPTVRIEEF